MKINWFTVIAQVINFLILVWLLRRILYKPVLKAIDERENKIASQLKDARAKETEAKKEQEEFQKKNDDFDQKKKGLMDKAVAETKVEREKLLEAARVEAAGLRSRLDKALKEAQENLNRDIAQKTQAEVFAIARKTLADLASLSLEEQSANIFIKRLNELTTAEKKQFIQAFKTSSNPILIRTAFDLPAKQQTEIKSAVNETLETKSNFQFKTAPELISGIELAANGFKLAWSISEYLKSLQNRISETMKEELKAEPKDEPKPGSKDDSKPESEDEPKSGSKDESKPKQKDKLKQGPKAKPKIRKKAKPEIRKKAKPEKE